LVIPKVKRVQGTDKINKTKQKVKQILSRMKFIKWGQTYFYFSESDLDLWRITPNFSNILSY